MMEFCACTSKPPLPALILLNTSKMPSSIKWGEETVLEVNGRTLKSDYTITKFLALLDIEGNWFGDSDFHDGEVNHWVSFSFGPLTCPDAFDDAIAYMDSKLKSLTYFVANRVTLADIAVYSQLLCNREWHELVKKNRQPLNLHRWFNLIKNTDFVRKTIDSLPKDIQLMGEKTVNKEEEIVELPGAEMGKVVVRFILKGGSFFHIGHAISAFFNQYYKDAYKGKLIIRFDDTNSNKEEANYEKVILNDLKLFKIAYDNCSHTSNHFNLLLKMCEKLLIEGKAYIDDTDPDVSKAEIQQKIASKNRNNSVLKNVEMWHQMVQGTEYGVKCCVRAKIDMNSLNIWLRDPTIYRCRNEPHPKTGDQYKVYPTYDFACPIVDSVEGVTHCLRTTEYRDRDALFFWFVKALGLKKPYILEYSRLNMAYTVLSQKHLTWIVDNKYVTGWDDPRMPTVRGLMRRGMTADCLKQFFSCPGYSPSVIDWNQIWAVNRKIIDPVAPRYTAVNQTNHVLVHIAGVKEEALIVPKHPKNPKIGQKKIWIGPEIIVNEADAQLFKKGENVTLVNYGNILIKEILRRNGKIAIVKAVSNLEDKNYKKTTKIIWLAITKKSPLIPCSILYFDHIITKPSIGKDENIKDYINKESITTIKTFVGSELLNLKKFDIIQLQRRGLFICEEVYSWKYPLALIAIPVGNVKDMPTAPIKNLHLLPENATPISNKTDVKAAKSNRDDIAKDMAQLVELKMACKTATGNDWKPGDTQIDTPKETGLAPAQPTTSTQNNRIAELLNKIKEQNDQVMSLFASSAEVPEISAALKALKSLRVEYKELTGHDHPNIMVRKITKPKDSSLNKLSPIFGLEVEKANNLTEWYSQVLIKGEMIEFYDVNGCYILRPWSFAIWESIKEYLDAEFKKMGVKNCYFPILVPRNVIEKEKAHFSNFSPDVAWVTKSGNSELAEPIAVRPTSETVMYPTYAKWIQSHRDLPIKLNQWNNVVRWESEQSQPFLRTKEFVWQEGHSAFEKYEEAEEEVYKMLDIYSQIYTDLMAIPVIKGRKTDREKFAGSDFTLTAEAYVPAAGRAIQGCSSNHLGQNFSKVFDITYNDPDTQDKKFVYQNSWGISTRMIGILVMVHGDNRGLILPPKLACLQVIIIPCGITVFLPKPKKDRLIAVCQKLQKDLIQDGIRAEADIRDYSSGWKFNHYDLKGVPIRIEIGPKDLPKKEITTVRRDTNEKLTIKYKDAISSIKPLLTAIQSDLLKKATDELNGHMVVCKDWKSFCENLDNKNIIQVPFCGEIECEENIVNDTGDDNSTGAKSLCIPFSPLLPHSPENCIHPRCTKKSKFYTLFGRSY